MNDKSGCSNLTDVTLTTTYVITSLDAIMAMKIRFLIFGVSILCSDVIRYRRFVGSYYLKVEAAGPPKRRYPTTTLHGVIPQKTSTRTGFVTIDLQ
jgi:hypothetical protein